MSQTATPLARKSALVGVAADAASVAFDGAEYPLISLEVIADGIVSDLILPASVLPAGLDVEDEVIITFARRSCRLCGALRSSAWAEADLCSSCKSVLRVVDDLVDGDDRCSE